VQRSIVVNAPPERIAALIQDFHHWPRWAPEDKADSSFKRSYSGAASGKGAVSYWVSQKSGEGRMEITAASSDKTLVTVDWQKPFVAHNINEFRFEPQNGSTNVTWSLEGENVFTLKVMTVFVSADRMMGGHFEQGLANLKAAAEK
jgi:hypothetical protein